MGRGPSVRLHAFHIRDLWLQASAMLVTRHGGPPVYPYQPKDLWTELSRKTYPQSSGPDLYRRSIYTYFKRTINPPLMATFDASQRESCILKKETTNTPLQALMTLNDVTFVECSKHLAEKLIRVSDNLNLRLKYGFLSVTSRNPNPTELKALTDLYQQCQREQASELDSMTAVASVLLNLDEIMSR